MHRPSSSRRVWTTAESVVAEVRRRRGAACAGCPAELCGHEVVMSLMMGFADAPLCLDCLARGLELDREELLRRLLRSVRRKGCLAAGWIEADGDPRASRITVDPPVRMPDEDETSVEPIEQGPIEQGPIEQGPIEQEPLEQGEGKLRERAGTPAADAEYDAGDQACGDLVLLLRRKMESMEAGSVLVLRATDPSAPYDLPAWCRLTRHRLLRQEHPRYWIRRRED